MDTTEKFEADMRLTHALLVATRGQLTATLEQPATKARDAQIRMLLNSIEIVQTAQRANEDTIIRRQQ